MGGCVPSPTSKIQTAQERCQHPSLLRSGTVNYDGFLVMCVKCSNNLHYKFWVIKCEVQQNKVTTICLLLAPWGITRNTTACRIEVPIAHCIVQIIAERSAWKHSSLDYFYKVVVSTVMYPLLEPTHLGRTISRGQNTAHPRALEELLCFLIMCIHYTFLNPSTMGSALDLAFLSRSQDNLVIPRIQNLLLPNQPQKSVIYPLLAVELHKYTLFRITNCLVVINVEYPDYV
jgi:hypothetical protein